jgi:hypothetical protein
MKNPNFLTFFNKKLKFNFFYDKITGVSLKLGPRAGPGSPTFELAGAGGHGPQFLKITGGHGPRAAKCHGYSPLRQGIIGIGCRQSRLGNTRIRR